MKSLTYKHLMWLTFWLWLGFVVGMSTFVTHDMAAHPAAQAFADFMAQFIPMLDNIRKIPGATEWVRFYYAVFWALSPVFFILAWKMSDLHMAVKVMKPISRCKWFLMNMGLLPFSMVAWSWPVADGVGWRDQSVTTNIVGIGHYSFVLLCVWLLLGSQFRGSYYFMTHGTPYWPCGKSSKKMSRAEV